MWQGALVARHLAWKSCLMVRQRCPLLMPTLLVVLFGLDGVVPGRFSHGVALSSGGDPPCCLCDAVDGEEGEPEDEHGCVPRVAWLGNEGGAGPRVGTAPQPELLGFGLFGCLSSTLDRSSVLSSLCLFSESVEDVACAVQLLAVAGAASDG